MTSPVLVHLGCANRYYEGFINTDKATTIQGLSGRSENKIDAILDIGKKWPFEDESVDGITSMHVLQQVSWRELISGLREAHRVLKRGGVFRFGCPSVEIQDKTLDFLLGWNNINLFSKDLLTEVFNRLGFSSFRECRFHDSAMPELVEIDNRKDRGTRYYEAIK